LGNIVLKPEGIEETETAAATAAAGSEARPAEWCAGAAPRPLGAEWLHLKLFGQGGKKR